MPDAAPVLALVTVQRLYELLLSARNETRLRARGAFEVGKEHYPMIVGLHAAWLLGLWILAWPRPVNWWLIAAYVALQGLRYWVMASLGERWTTRVIVLPGAPLVRAGPYRYLRHPNYIVVIAEIALLPLAFGMVIYAIVFSIANAMLLALRIRVENRALAETARTQ
jgi:methyltransferase